MENENNEIAELRDRVDGFERQLIVASNTTPSHMTAPQFRSFGDFVHAVVAGDENALGIVRTYTGGTLSDSVVKDAWVSDVIRLVDFGRPTVTAFRTAGLPAEGMNVDWPQVNTNTIATGTQAAEGDTLAFGEITLESKTSPVKTFGGYTSMSRQVIERSSVAYLDAAFRAMAIAYSKYVNAAAITALKAVSGAGSVSAGSTAKLWYGGIADAAVSIYGNTGLRPEFILAAPDVFKKVATIFDSTDRPIVGANVNGVGNANLVGLTANIGGLPMVVDPALSTGDCWIANREAFVTYESAGAPFRLAHEEITNLTKDFSVYGYAAFATPLPAALVKVTVS